MNIELGVERVVTSRVVRPFAQMLVGAFAAFDEDIRSEFVDGLVVSAQSNEGRLRWYQKMSLMALNRKDRLDAYSQIRGYGVLLKGSRVSLKLSTSLEQ